MLKHRNTGAHRRVFCGCNGGWSCGGSLPAKLGSDGGDFRGMRHFGL